MRRLILGRVSGLRLLLRLARRVTVVVLIFYVGIRRLYLTLVLVGLGLTMLTRGRHMLGISVFYRMRFRWCLMWLRVLGELDMRGR